MTEQEQAKKLNDQLQEKSNIIYRCLIEIKEKTRDIQDRWGIQDSADALLSEWRYLDNAISNDRAEWQEIEKKEVQK